ncbi:hypothetical protein [Nostoc sp.]|uniref:hypothetical protein n=1 Tax=Nostoc sp. TaxID=1180 RepID=UPI002FF8F1C4
MKVYSSQLDLESNFKSSDTNNLLFGVSISEIEPEFLVIYYFNCASLRKGKLLVKDLVNFQVNSYNILVFSED